MDQGRIQPEPDPREAHAETEPPLPCADIPDVTPLQVNTGINHRVGLSSPSVPPSN